MTTQTHHGSNYRSQNSQRMPSKFAVQDDLKTGKKKKMCHNLRKGKRMDVVAVSY